ncbi:MAG: hypothetical protein J4473_01765 [Candidatus Aenigmarchaeota archaeon]|nr:hypothetical protein [Candidatus Aenigmarchaeota archaeon]
MRYEDFNRIVDGSQLHDKEGVLHLQKPGMCEPEYKPGHELPYIKSSEISGNDEEDNIEMCHEEYTPGEPRRMCGMTLHPTGYDIGRGMNDTVVAVGDTVWIAEYHDETV